MVASFFQYLLPFMLMLGILVLIHELGHFLVARYFGVRVEVFSIGFGPKLFKLKKGDTIYCISLIPLGGYVKMFGDNPKKLPQGEDRKKGFLSQKVGAKSLIALGGPVMNCLLAIFLFMFLSFLGRQQALPVLGDIHSETKAYDLGFRADDKILSINDQKIQYWSDVQKKIRKSPEKNLTIQVERLNKIETIQITPDKIKNDKLSHFENFIGKIEGLSIVSKSAHIGVYSNHSIAYKRGLRTFDEIKEINGISILNWRDLKKFFKQNSQKKLNIKVQRDKEEKLITIPLPVHSVAILKKLGIESTELYIDRVKNNSPAYKSGLQKKDRFFALNGTVLKSWEEFSSLIQDNKGFKPFNLTILRDGQKQDVVMKAKKMSTVQEDGVIKDRPMIGVASAQYISLPSLVHVRTLNPIKALNVGVKETFRWSAVTGKVLWKLVTGNLSYRVMGGPLSIAKAARKSFSESLSEFLAVMAIISVNLFLMNLLPIPVLDGGYLLLFAIEGIKGSSLSPQKVEFVQIIGFVFVVFFIVLTFFNDIGNWDLIW